MKIIANIFLVVLIFFIAGIVLLEIPTGKYVPPTPIEQAKIFVTQTIDTPLLAYSVDTGSYPNTEQGLQALIAKPENMPEGVGNAKGWRGPYINDKTIPYDAGGHPFQYAYPGIHNGTTKPDVWSVGPDGQSGTADDLGNWLVSK